MARAPASVQIKTIRSLTADEFKLLERIEPATVSKMMRQRVTMTNHGMFGIKSWLRENTTGLYYQPSDSAVWFESEEDLVLLLAAFQGKAKGQS